MSSVPCIANIIDFTAISQSVCMCVLYMKSIIFGDFMFLAKNLVHAEIYVVMGHIWYCN